MFHFEAAGSPLPLRAIQEPSAQLTTLQQCGEVSRNNAGAVKEPTFARMGRYLGAYNYLVLFKVCCLHLCVRVCMRDREGGRERKKNALHARACGERGTSQQHTKDATPCWVFGVLPIVRFFYSRFFCFCRGRPHPALGHHSPPQTTPRY